MAEGDMEDFFSSLDLPRFVILALAGGATVIACQICIMLIAQHLTSWSSPRQQRPIICIILMVPVFAVDSYIGLLEMPGSEVGSTVLHSVKECYEAFVIAQFLVLMYGYMGVEKDKSAPLPDSMKGRKFHYSLPFSLFMGAEGDVDRRSLGFMSLWATQFVFIRPVLSVIICILELFNAYEPPLSWLFTLIFNVSVTVAVSALLMFYHTFHEELAPHNPFIKFLCIKGVVFFSFWQGMVVSGLAALGIIHEGHFPYTVTQVKEATQNFLICLEMLAFAFIFRKAFSSSEFELSRRQIEERKDK
eukprot:TRINITY_DN1416_c0_g1_i1.p1 TRINITY_DN1416_c0_g1~~TRINITY_DN1416_c0_g1_i1.p1  ORF type:complete len:348 (-),score=82.50 TRINITY_DN1416_c0_g1_i1:275-1183(-)